MPPTAKSSNAAALLVLLPATALFALLTSALTMRTQGGAAERSGLVRAGDLLLAIGAADAQQMRPEEATALLEHWRGPTVRMRVLRTPTPTPTA